MVNPSGVGVLSPHKLEGMKKTSSFEKVTFELSNSSQSSSNAAKRGNVFPHLRDLMRAHTHFFFPLRHSQTPLCFKLLGPALNIFS